jgi:hypothetical protein
MQPACVRSEKVTEVSEKEKASISDAGVPFRV